MKLLSAPMLLPVSVLITRGARFLNVTRSLLVLSVWVVLSVWWPVVLRRLWVWVRNLLVAFLLMLLTDKSLLRLMQVILLRPAKFLVISSRVKNLLRLSVLTNSRAWSPNLVRWCPDLLLLARTLTLRFASRSVSCMPRLCWLTVSDSRLLGMMILTWAVLGLMMIPVILVGRSVPIRKAVRLLDYGTTLTPLFRNLFIMVRMWSLCTLM